MSGIYPNSGVPASQAANTVDVNTANCTTGELFHSTARCNPRFDPAAANALISELLNVVSAAGLAYDCSRLDNLKLALEGLQSCACPPLFGSGVPTTTPGLKESQFYIDTSTVFDTIYWWNGVSWQKIGTTAQPNQGIGVPVGAPAQGESNYYFDTTTPAVPIQYWWDGSLWRVVGASTNNALILRPKGVPIVVTASGTYTPSGSDVVASNVQLAAGGGGGAGVTNTAAGQAHAGSGGSAGGYVQKFIFGPTTATIVIGGAGLGGLAPTQGGNTSFVDTAFTLSANGGVAGVAMTGLPGASPVQFRARVSQQFGAFGSATGGDVNIPGAVGGTAVAHGGTDNGNFVVAASGHGGEHPMGQGGVPETWSGSPGSGAAGSNGGAGTGFGAGGAGGSQINSGSKTGGDGAPGGVIIQEYIAI